jgi:hypothetical protein
MRTLVTGVCLALLIHGAVWAVQVDLSDPSAYDTRAWGAEEEANLGYSVAVGDFDGDGEPDLAIGAPGFGGASVGSRIGAVYVLLAKNGVLDRDLDLTDADAEVTIVGETDYTTGYALAAGDVNGDGVDDLIAGAARAPGPSDEPVLGAVFVFFGRETWPANMTTTADADAVIWGEKSDGQFGARLAVADFDGDGVADLFAAAPGFADVGAPAAGKAYGFLGGSIEGVIDLRLPATLADVEVVGEIGGQRLGVGLAVGDLDGDGLADLAMGAPGLTPPAPGSKESFPGVAYVVRGRELAEPLRINLASAAPDVRVDWPDQTGNLGAALAMGDIDNDGFLDLVIGAPNLPAKAAKSTAGEVFVVHGQFNLPATIDLAVADLTIHGAQADDRFGFALATGDFTGDCVADLLVGAPRFEALNKSHAYAFEGRADYPAQYVIDLAAGDAPLHTILAAVARDETGFAVGAADLDLDGVADLIVAARAFAATNPARPEAGAVYVIRGDGDNQPPTADAGPDQQTPVNEPVMLDGTGSDDPDGARLTYRWEQPDGPADAAIQNADTATPTVTLPVPGAYRFRLTVADCAFVSAPDEVAVTAGTPDDDDSDDDDASGDDDDNGDGLGDDDDDAGVYGGGGCTG